MKNNKHFERPSYCSQVLINCKECSKARDEEIDCRGNEIENNFESDTLDTETPFLEGFQDENEIEQHRRLSKPYAIIDYIPKGFDPEAHRARAIEWNAITKRYEADPNIMLKTGD